MYFRKWIVYVGLLLFHACIPICQAQEINHDGLGQIIQINTRFHSFVGKPSWLLIIRDLDNDQSVPYVFDISRGDNFWFVFTYGKDYLISVSKMQMSTYKSRHNNFGEYEINDFCHLESNGRIIHGESMSITIEGDLSPDPSSITCHVSKYPDTNFSVVNPTSSE